MRVIVLGNDGSEAFSYDTRKDAMCTCPGLAEKPAVAAAVLESYRFLAGTKTLTERRSLEEMEP